MFSNNIWWTRKARIQAEKRLLSNAFQAQLLLLWYSFCSVAISIYYLKFNTDSDYAGVSWVVFSVLVLCISGFINGLSYKERASLIKECYETLNGLYQKAKAQGADVAAITVEYEQVLGVCENHKDIDYYTALCKEYLSNPAPKHEKNGLDRFPTRYIWLNVAAYIFSRYFVLFLMYVLPIALYFIMERMSDC